jgi:hypothetical protein
MTRYVTLDNVDHADLRVARVHGAAHGDAVNQLLVFPTEFEALQRELPILFRRDEQGDFYAVALLGLDLDENLFLGADGWTTRYVPAVQQRGPFARDGSGALLIDLDDPRVGTEGGEPLFLRHGGETPYLRHVAAVLDTVHRGAENVRPFFEALAAGSLIRPVKLEIAVGDGASYSVDEAFTIDEERLVALSGTTLDRLHASGVLRAATMAAASLANVQRLIELKTRGSR